MEEKTDPVTPHGGVIGQDAIVEAAIHEMQARTRANNATRATDIIRSRSRSPMPIPTGKHSIAQQVAMTREVKPPSLSLGLCRVTLTLTLTLTPI